MYFDTDILLDRISSISPTNNEKPIYVTKSGFVSQVILSAQKYIDKIKYSWRKIQEPVRMNLCAFSAAQEVYWRTRRNATLQFL